MYVIPEKGEALAKQLREAFASGRFDSATTAPALADALNRELEAANDRHLNVRLSARDASQPVLTVAAWEKRRAEMRGASPHGPGAGPRPSREYDREPLRLANYGVLGAQVLEGNVGYLKISGFFGTEETRKAMDHAMALLANTDAVIVDLRDCPGGSPVTVEHLASYFFGPEPRVLMKHFHRPSGTNWDSTTVKVPGKRMPDADVYVLTARTGSACEAFAFTLQQWGRGKTVGERSGGGGFNNVLIDVGLGLVFSVSVGTATHPKTNKGWEAVGVQPDIPAPADRALDTAHIAALRALETKTASEPQKRAIRTALQRLTATPAATLGIRTEDYVGKYGVREVTLRDGVLWFQRTGGSGGPLQPIGRDEFDLNGQVVVAFERDDKGTVKAMRLRLPDGRTETVARE